MRSAIFRTANASVILDVIRSDICVCVCFLLPLYRRRPKIFRGHGQNQSELDPSETTVHHEEELTSLYGSAFLFRPLFISNLLLSFPV